MQERGIRDDKDFTRTGRRINVWGRDKMQGGRLEVRTYRWPGRADGGWEMSPEEVSDIGM